MIIKYYIMYYTKIVGFFFSLHDINGRQQEWTFPSHPVYLINILSSPQYVSSYVTVKNTAFVTRVDRKSHVLSSKTNFLFVRRNSIIPTCCYRRNQVIWRIWCRKPAKRWRRLWPMSPRTTTWIAGPRCKTSSNILIFRQMVSKKNIPPDLVIIIFEQLRDLNNHWKKKTKAKFCSRSKVQEFWILEI